MTQPLAPVRAVTHMPKVVSVNWLRIREDLAAVDSLNAKLAILLTRVVGTMWCFWAFNGIALVSLPSAVHQHSLTVLINWVSSNWLQLILLPALMVGQNLQSVAGDQLQRLLSEHMNTVLDCLDTSTAGGLQTVLATVLAAIAQARNDILRGTRPVLIDPATRRSARQAGKEAQASGDKQDPVGLGDGPPALLGPDQADGGTDEDGQHT